MRGAWSALTFDDLAHDVHGLALRLVIGANRKLRQQPHEDELHAHDAEENREQEAREYLIRESERVLREREEREMWHIPQEPAPEPVSSALLIIVRPPSEEAEGEVCKCGYP